jgi:hypothetical protein
VDWGGLGRRVAGRVISREMIFAKKGTFDLASCSTEYDVRGE